MSLFRRATLAAALLALAPAVAAPLAAQATADSARLERLKAEALTRVEGRAKLVQEIIDHLFSFSELGFQEFETQRYLTGLLEQNGFQITRGYAGMPSAWVARWVSPAGARPVITMGSDVDGIPQSNNKPGVAYLDPQVQGAPGHGEGHNTGQAVNIAAALSVKELMIRDRIPGTIVIWPGIAEEQMAGKAFLVREGLFRDADVALFTHVGNSLGVSWGQSGQTALVSAIFRFKGTSAHAAGAPWRGRSALDAAMLMGTGWEYQREHNELPTRSHYVILDGGDQPNVVPPTASIWFYFRERDYPRTMALFEAGKRIARGAAMMANVELDTVMVVGSGWSGHFNKTIAEVTYENIKRVGMPTWSDEDQALARGLQQELGGQPRGLSTAVEFTLQGPTPESQRMGGGSDDIGDVSWNVPTVTLRYPSNIPGLPGHNWSSSIASATPIAHKGALQGAKVQALTMLDILLRPQVVADAWKYFREVQTAETKYTPFISPTDQPPIWMNADIMARYKPELQKYYYDARRYRTYLEQLGIRYPTTRATPKPNMDENDGR
ncbi:peptidase dimerization domain-containing protein [Pseudogemmatithrix spongiicola]|uniref:Peptidase dimerization domain-containing protein n=1 Tax=Pseudogemmatithrix spongiicola TaxID=3062599 RepID=A0AA49Q925_9BACT|nr:peptidase dimerization domain-containing protein [Gemmatimonadaceae bacterium 'strain 138']WKW16406.1 peptidase dimerization domain-containing protein [Gemmatimonadaceae bacterium 'strain 318']